MSIFNEKYLPLFQSNWSETERAQTRLKASLSRLAIYFPLQTKDFDFDNEDLFEKLDAFRVRFAALQDALGNKMFRTLLLLEDETSLNMAETLSKMEKRRIIPQIERWRLMRELRNEFSHDYPEAIEKKVAALNQAWLFADDLIAIVANFERYAREQGFFNASY